MLRPPFQVCLRLLAGLIACLAASGVSAAEHATEQAKRSFYAGDFATARVRYQALAEEGYGEAQAALAGMLLRGQGGPADPVEAIRWLRRAAIPEGANYRMGAVWGVAAKLAEIYTTGEVVPPWPEEAARWLHRVVEGGKAGADTELGRLAKAGVVEARLRYQQAVNGGDVDDADAAFDALDFLKESAEAGDVRAEAAYGKMLLVRWNEKKALPWLLKAAEKGDAEAMADLAYMFADSDPATARRWAARGVIAGHVVLARTFPRDFPGDRPAAADAVELEALRRVALVGDPADVLAYGRLAGGAPADGRAAYAGAVARAQAGDVAAQRLAGLALLVGDGVEQDRQAGIRWLEKAAAANDPDAAYQLFRIRCCGQPEETDEAAAARWRDLAVALESPSALFLVSLEISESYPSATDAERAADLAQAAALAGHPTARYGLAEYAEDGFGPAERALAIVLLADGTEASSAEASLWLRRAAAYGDGKAKRLLAARLAAEGSKQNPR